MPLGLVDGGLVLTFGALAASDGLARVPLDAVVFARTLGGGWSARARSDRPMMRLVSPLAPVRSGLVVAWTGDVAVRQEEFVERMQRTAGRRRALELLGVVQLVAFAMGVPTAVAYWSGFGLVAAVLGVTTLGIAIAVVARGAMRALGPGVGDGLGARLARGLSPFSAAAAANDVMQAAVRGVPAVAVACALFVPEDFARWARPFAWDHAHREPDETLVSSLGEKALARLIADEPIRLDAMAQAYCPRCANEFAREAAECAPCGLAVRVFTTRQD